MNARIILLGALLSVLVASSAQAVHQSGSTTELVGFSADDSRMMLRYVNTQIGVQRFVIVDLKAASSRTVHPVGPQDDPNVLERALRRTYQIDSLGFIGGVSPSGHAAVVVKPKHSVAAESLHYGIRWHDADGVRNLDDVTGLHRCANLDGERIRFRITWSPRGNVAVVTGGVTRTEACESPATEPILIVERSQSMKLPRNGWLGALSRSLGSHTRRLEGKRHEDALHMAHQWLSLAPGHVKPLLAVARLRTQRGDLFGALRTLWVVRGLPDNRGLTSLRGALRHSWTKPLHSFASYKALQWELTSGRQTSKKR